MEIKIITNNFKNMKEKIKNIFKNKYFKIVVLILLGLFILRELYSVYVDMYNFKQLEKAKIVLNGINDFQFNNIFEFNSKFNQNIKPIKNCYLFGDKNGFFDENKYYGSFYFGFKLESLIYIYIYKKKYFLYPNYDLPYRSWCEAGIGCYDKNREFFESFISNPCKD